MTRTAAQVIGTFGAVEFPNNSWPELPPTILNNISAPTIPLEPKVASLEVSSLIVIYVFYVANYRLMCCSGSRLYVR